MHQKTEDLPLVEIGWLAAGKLDDVDWRAVQRARDSLTQMLSNAFPQFQWQMPIVRWEELAIGPRAEPSELLEHGVAERNAKHWDFTVIITGVELIGHYFPETIAVVSRSLDSALISTSQIDPRSTDPEVDVEQRTSTIADRLQRLVLYTFSRLCGLERDEDDHANLLFKPAEVSDLDHPAQYSTRQKEQLVRELSEIADRRLEEDSDYRTVKPWRFYLLSTWVNRRDISNAVREARPWQFPFRLSRLTTAALSAMLVLIVTAEVWELAISQDRVLVAVFSLAAVCIATTYIVLNQGLYVRRGKSRLTEQSVTTNVTMGLVVSLGMTTTYILIFCMALLAGSLFFDHRLVVQWSGGLAQPPLLDEYLLLSAFVAALALGIGALGASFESSHYFRHITFVDEEV